MVAMSSEYELVRSLLTGKQEKEHHGICFLEGQVEGCRVVLVKVGDR